MKRTLIFFFAVFGLLLCLVCAVSAAGDSGIDTGEAYPTVSAPQGDGGWYYMASPEGTDFLEYMPAFVGNKWWAGENNFQMGMHEQDHIHPGLNYDAVLVFKVPAAGNITIQIPQGVTVNDSSWAERPGDGVTFGIFYRDDDGVHALLPMTDVGNGETLSVDPITLDVAQNALLMFRCSNGHDHYMDYDNTHMAPEITYHALDAQGKIAHNVKLPPMPGEKYPVSIGCEPINSDNPTVVSGVTYEIGADKNGTVLSLADIQTDGAEVIISASDVAITDFSVNGGSVTVTGERVTMVCCSVNAPVTVKGAGFFAQNCNFADVSISGNDAVVARCALSEAVRLTGKNQTLYGNTIAKSASIDGASDISVIANTFAASAAGTVAASEYVNLSDNTCDGDPAQLWQYDDRGVIWGSDLPGTLDGTDYAGVDASRLPQNNNDRFADSITRTHVYYNGEFVPPSVYLVSAAANYEEVIFPAGIYENLPQFSLLAQENTTVAAYGMCARFASYTISAILINQSDNIRILGMTVDHMMNANAQGTVVANTGGKLIWQPADGDNGAITDESLFAKNGASLGFKAGEKLPYVDQSMPDRTKNSDGT